MWRGPLAYGQATQKRILSWREAPSPMRDDKRNLAPHAFAKSVKNLGGGAPHHLLVQLGQLPGHRHLALRQHLCQNGQRAPHAVRRFEGDNRLARLPQRLEEAAQLTWPAGQVARKAEARATEAGGCESGGDRAWTWNRYDSVAGRPGRVHQALAWVRQSRRARVGYQRNVAL